MEAITAPDRLTRIKALNDAFRSSFVAGGVTITQGIAALCPEVTAEVLRRVRAFNILASKFCWKLDCHDRVLECGSPDPADPSVTTRVLTVMRADED
jgi:hypothetical protein